MPPTAPNPSCAVILAAGMGSRLRADRPKGMIELGGGPLLGRSLGLLREAGVEEIVLVAGWRQDIYREYLEENFPAVRVLENPAFARTGSLASLLIGARATVGNVLVVESDLLYEKRALSRLFAAPGRDTLLASGYTRSGDEVWVYAHDRRLARLSKQAWGGAPRCGELVGLTCLSRPALDGLLAVAPALPVGAHYEDGLNAISAAHRIDVCLVDDLQWCEIDTQEHLQRAREQVWPRIQMLDRNRH
ncbi:MAG: NTP transferase domain-containing protein [Opitutaceae bacterium]|nr:NTP transferase domain-containing protein [Opitutaceae bacterium]